MTLGHTILEQSRVEIAKLAPPDRVLPESLLKPAASALESKDIANLKTALAPIQLLEARLNVDQKKSLHDLLVLIHEWEQAKPGDVLPKTPAPSPDTAPKTEAKTPVTDLPKGFDWKAKAK